MNGNGLNSNIDPSAIAALNSEDAKKFDNAIGVISNEMPSKIHSIKESIENVESGLRKLKAVNFSFDMSEEMANLDNGYKHFSSDVITQTADFEFNIINVINIFDKANSMDGTSTIDYNFFNNLPFLGTIMFTTLTYFGNGNKLDDIPQLSVDIADSVADRDFNSALGNLIYNGVETLGEFQKWNFEVTNSIAAAALIGIEFIYNYSQGTDSQIQLVNATSHAAKLVAGNMFAHYVATPTATAISSSIIADLGETVAVKIIGGAAGGVLGIGIVLVGSNVVDSFVDPIADEITGEALIEGTTIPKNGGKSSLYSGYKRLIETNFYSPIGRTMSFNNMTVSYEYCQKRAQIDPIETMLGIDEYAVVEDSVQFQALETYIDKLQSIPKDSTSFAKQVEQLTTEATIGINSGSGEYVYNLVNELGFDPYSYALNN